MIPDFVCQQVLVLIKFKKNLAFILPVEFDFGKVLNGD